MENVKASDYGGMDARNTSGVAGGGRDCGNLFSHCPEHSGEVVLVRRVDSGGYTNTKEGELGL